MPPAPEGRIKYGVSTYSYTGDVNTSMTLEDVFAEIADLGATGIEILGEGNIPDYPTPDPAWIDTWHGLVQKYGLTPTNYGSWVDTTRWHDRDLTAEEGAEQLQLDLRLAKQLGFTSVRPKFGVTSWDLDPHPIWQETRRAVAGPGRRARRRHLPGDPHADADQAPGDPGLHRLHREDRHRALQAAHRHRHLQHRADPRESRRRSTATARRSRRTCGRWTCPWPTSSRCCRTRTSSRPSSWRSTTTCTTCTFRGPRSSRRWSRPGGRATCPASTRAAGSPTAAATRCAASTPSSARSSPDGR